MVETPPQRSSANLGGSGSGMSSLLSKKTPAAENQRPSLPGLTSSSAIEQKSEAKAGKLLKGLDVLSSVSNNLNQRLLEQQNELQEKQQKQSQKQTENNRALENKLSNLTNQKQVLKQEQVILKVYQQWNSLEQKQTQLKDKADIASQEKQNLLQLKLMKSKMVENLKQVNQDAISQKNQLLQDLQNQIRQLKNDLKDLRQRNKGLESQEDDQEELKIKKNLALNDANDKTANKDKLRQAKEKELAQLKQQKESLKDQLQDLQEEMDKQDLANQKLKQQVSQLKDINSELAREADKAPQDIDELQLKIDRLENETLKEQEKGRELEREAGQLKAINEDEELKQENLKAVQDLIRRQVEFEKMSRQIQIGMNDTEEKLRQLELKAKTLQKQVKTMLGETGIQNESLLRDFDGLLSSIQDLQSKKNDIKEDLKITQSKVLGKSHQELRIENMKFNQEKLSSQNEVSLELQTQVEDAQTTYHTIEGKVQLCTSKSKAEIQSQVNDLLDESQDVISGIYKTQRTQITGNDQLEQQCLQKEIQNDSQMAIMEKIKQKASALNQLQKALSNLLKIESLKTEMYQSQNQRLKDDNLTNYVNLRLLAREQNERLKAIKDIEQLDLQIKLNDIDKALEQFEAQAQQDQLLRNREAIARGENHLRDIDKIIDTLGTRMDDLDTELLKLDSPEDEDMRKELERDLEALKKQLDNTKEQKTNVQNQLEKAKGLGDEELIHSTFGETEEQLKQLQEKRLPDIENELYDLEKQLKKVLNKKRSEKKKDCLDRLDKNRLYLQKLQDQIDKIDDEIKKTEKGTKLFQQSYNYKDLEREDEVENRLREPLKEQKQNYLELKETKDLLNKQLQDLEKNIELHNAVLIRSNSTSPGKDQKGKEADDQDEIVKLWSEFLDESEALGEWIEDGLDKASKLGETQEVLNHSLIEIGDKYRLKDDKYREAQDNQQLKQQKLDEMKLSVAEINKQLLAALEIMKQIVPPEDNPDFLFEFQEKEKVLNKSLEKVAQSAEKAKALQARLDEICEDLTKLGQKKVTNQDLDQILDDLNKLDIDYQYEGEEINTLTNDSTALLAHSKALYDKNKQILIEECDGQIQELGERDTTLDDKYSTVEKKLAEYLGRIKEGIKENMQDEQVVRDLKGLKSEAELIEKVLRDIDKRKYALRQREKQNRDEFNKLQVSRMSSQLKSFDQLERELKGMNKQAEELEIELKDIDIDLDKRILELDGYIQRQGELLSQYRTFDSMISSSNRDLLNFTKKLDELSDLTTLVKNVLLEMEKGVANDYQLKEGFIRTELDEVQEIEDVLFKMDEQRNQIAVHIQSLKNDKIKPANEGGKITIQCLDQEVLDKLIRETEEVQKTIKSFEFQTSNCIKKINLIRRDIGIADIPELIQLREREIVDFSARLRKVEQEYTELRKLVALVGGQNKELNQEIVLIDRQIKGFRDDKVSFQRMLGQDLQVFLPNPQRLEDLIVLRDVIERVRELGLKTNKGLEEIEQVQNLALKLKRQIGGADMAKRINELEQKEQDQRERLVYVKIRLEVIGKGASDCDGYTSNTEEATFIDTLLNELPEIFQKQKDSVIECDQLSNHIYELNRLIEVQKTENNDRQDQYIKEYLGQEEDNADLNEKTVAFLEKLLEKLEDHFLQMDVKKKLDKRQMELQELHNIGEDFSEKLLDMQEHLLQDIEKIQQKTQVQSPIQGLLYDEQGNPVNLLEEMMQVQDELKEILDGVSDLQSRNDTIRQRRQEVQEEFDDKVLRNSPYKHSSPGKKITNKEDMFTLLKANGQMKKKIIEMIKQLKDVSRRMRDQKMKYQSVRNKLESQAPRKLYKAVKGDLVDELFADYINRLNCPVQIKRLGNNYYTFGTKKIFAKIINGKLVIRVGGGYMGIEEFMMYYGQQELQKIQKEELKNHVVTEEDVGYGDMNIGGGLLGDNFLTDDDETSGGRKSTLGADAVDIDQLQQKIKEESAKKKKRLANRSFGGSDEEDKNESPKKNQVVGIGDVRKALKKNVFTIQTYEENKVGQQVKKGKAVNTEVNQVENNLRKIEQRVGQKLKAGQESKGSPKKEKPLQTPTAAQMNQFSDKSSSRIKDFDQEQHQIKPPSSVQKRPTSKLPLTKK